MAKGRKVINKGGYVVNELFRGQLTNKTQYVVMDNSISPIPSHNKKIKVSYYITESLSVLVGQHTVALFRIKKRPAGNQALQIEFK